jgi:hypothetical protein
MVLSPGVYVGIHMLMASTPVRQSSLLMQHIMADTPKIRVNQQMGQAQGMKAGKVGQALAGSSRR